MQPVRASLAREEASTVQHVVLQCITSTREAARYTTVLTNVIKGRKFHKPFGLRRYVNAIQ
jgi:hypothetical protein